MIAAFGEPYAGRPLAKHLFIMLRGNADLRLHRVRVNFHKRKKAMGCSASNNFQFSGILEFTESVDEIFIVLIYEDLSGFKEQLVVHMGQRIKFGLPGGPV